MLMVGPAFLEIMDYYITHPNDVDVIIICNTSRLARSSEDAII